MLKISKKNCVFDKFASEFSAKGQYFSTFFSYGKSACVESNPIEEKKKIAVLIRYQKQNILFHGLLL